MFLQSEQKREKLFTEFFDFYSEKERWRRSHGLDSVRRALGLICPSQNSGKVDGIIREIKICSLKSWDLCCEFLFLSKILKKILICFWFKIYISPLKYKIKSRNLVYTSCLVEKTTTEHEDALWVLEIHLVVWMSRISGNTCLDIEVWLVIKGYGIPWGKSSSSSEKTRSEWVCKSFTTPSYLKSEDKVFI